MQLTRQPHGHILTNTAVWSPDSAWIVYDTRSDPAGAVFDGTRIERVHVESGKVETLYTCTQGACCGVPTYHPTQEKVVFILGPENPTADWQYGPCHRQGVIVETASPQAPLNLDARDLVSPFTPGALRGGSHVHVFSGDGKMVSFTYEDHVLALLDQQSGAPTEQDFNQRNVAITLVEVPVEVPDSHPRNHAGNGFSVVITRTVNHLRPGSDEISRAYEDAWVGQQGYLRADGKRQGAIAFLGDCVTDDGHPITELFVVEIPEDITQCGDAPLAGTPTRRPAPPAGTIQRRLTYTSHRKHPGIQGPRHWPRSNFDGSQIAFLMRDEMGQVQLWCVSPMGGEPEQITHHEFDIFSAFSWHPAGTQLAYIADGSVWVTEFHSRKGFRLTEKLPAELAPRSEACVFSPNGKWIAYVRPTEHHGAVYNQVWRVAGG